MVQNSRQPVSPVVALLASLLMLLSAGSAAAAEPALDAIQTVRFVVSVPPPAPAEVSHVQGCYAWSHVDADVARQSSGLTVAMVDSSPAGVQVAARNWVFGQLAGTQKVIAAFAGLTLTAPDGSTANFVWETPKRFCDGRSGADALPAGTSIRLPISAWKTEDRSEEYCARASLARAIDGSISADISMTAEAGGCGRAAADVLDNVPFAIETQEAPEMLLDSDGRSCGENVFSRFATARLTSAGRLPAGWQFDDAAVILDTRGGPGYVGTVSVSELYLTRPATQDWTPVFGPMNWEVCPGMEPDGKPVAVRIYGDAGTDGAHPRCFPGAVTIDRDGRVKLSGIFHWPCDAPTRPNGSPFITTRPSAFAVAPRESRHLFTVEETPIWPSGVLLESTDGGYSWMPRAPLPSSATAPGHFIVEVAPLGRGDTLLARDHIGSPTATASRVVRSTDLGATWRTVLAAGGPLTADPHDRGTAWVCSRGIVTKTIDAGRKWTRTRGHCSAAVAVSPDGRTLLAPTGRRLFRSTDGGAHWRAAMWDGDHTLLGSPTFDQDDQNVALAIDALGISRSSDRGHTWQRVWKTTTRGGASRLHVGGAPRESPRIISGPGRLVAGPLLGSTPTRGWITLVSYDHGRHWLALRAVADSKRPPSLLGAVAAQGGVIAPAPGNSSDATDFWILRRNSITWRPPPPA
jgi:photosystem II stability/assembly factor-like uncharacterized protein